MNKPEPDLGMVAEAAEGVIPGPDSPAAPIPRPAPRAELGLGPKGGNEEKQPARVQDSMADLAAAAANGDRGSFDAIYKRLSGGMFRLFMQRTNQRKEVAEDLSQRTWLGVWDALRQGRYDPRKSAITTFVYAVGYKIWLQHLRTASRPEFSADHVDMGGGVEVGNPQFESNASELLEAVRTCLKADVESPILTEEERGIVRASAGGASDREIAKQLNIAASTLNARKQAAFEKIRRVLASWGHRGERPERPGG